MELFQLNSSPKWYDIPCFLKEEYRAAKVTTQAGYMLDPNSVPYLFLWLELKFRFGPNKRL